MVVDTNEIERLVDIYIENQNLENRNNVLVACTPIIKVITQRIAKSIGYSVLPEDLEAYGYMGVIDALNRYDKSKEIKFTTYFPSRAAGSIRDELRKISQVPRTVLNVCANIDKVNEKLNREATPKELAKELNMSVEKVNEAMIIRERSKLEYLNSFLKDSEEEKLVAVLKDCNNIPEVLYLKNSYIKDVREALLTLKPKYLQVLKGMYYDSKTTAVISKELGITESRVSQIHTKSLEILREELFEKVDCNLFFC